MSEESEKWEVHIFTSYLLRKMSLQVSAGLQHYRLCCMFA